MESKKQIVDSFTDKPYQERQRLVNGPMLPTMSPEHKLSWLSIGDLKALLDCAKKCQDDLTDQDGTDIHDYWHNVIEKTVIEIKNKIFEIFPPES